MDEFDGIDPGIETGTVEYWKARARQWQGRCRRAEREKTELIAEIERLKLAVRGAGSVRNGRGDPFGASRAFGRR